MARFWAFCLAALLVSAGLPLRSQTQDPVTVEVTPASGRALARQALQTGNPDLAARIAAQLVQANPKDVGALLLLTAGLERSGQPEQAIAAGRKAYGLATTEAQRFEAAYLVAEALSVADRPGQAKFWLRRADSHSPGPAQSAVLRDAFQKLDARTPLKFSVTFAGGPTNNVNGGSLHDSFDFLGIPIPIAQALPGWVLLTTSQLSYRIIARPDRVAQLYAIARQRNVWLSPRALDLQAGATNADYLYNSLDLGGSVNWVSSAALAFSLDARAGRRWLGGEVQSDQQRLVFGTTRAQAAGRLARLDLTAETTRIPGTPRANSLRLAADGSLSQPLSGGVLRFDLGLANLDATAPGIAYRALSAGLDWQPDKPVLGLNVEFFLQGELRDYWKTIGYRPDMQVEAGAMARFPKASAYGFVPTVTLSASRTFSELAVRDTANIAVAFGVSSSF